MIFKKQAIYKGTKYTRVKEDYRNTTNIQSRCFRESQQETPSSFRGWDELLYIFFSKSIICASNDIKSLLI